MEYDLDEDEEIFRDTTRRFLEAEAPLTSVRTLSETEAGFDIEWWRRSAELGWTSLLVDEAYGGAGPGSVGLRYLAIVAEEMGRLVSPGPVIVTNVVAATLAASGSPHQQTQTLPAVVDGSMIATWCVAEGGDRWAVDDLTVTATRRDDEYVISGVKSPVEAAAEADLLLVTAATEAGLTQLLVPVTTPGVSIDRLDGIDLVRRFAAVTFDDVRVPVSTVVGAPGEAADDVERQLQIALALQCVESAGAADRVLEFTLEYASDRHSFGRPLASYQALKHRFADMKLWLEASHATADAAVRAVAVGSPDAPELVRIAKSYVADHLPELVQDCVQMHGGIGVTWEHDIHLYLRRIATNKFVFGAPAQHRDDLAGQLLATA